MQGRALGFLALLGTSWVAARIAIATVGASAQLPIVHAATKPRPTITNFESLAVVSRRRNRHGSVNAPAGHISQSHATRPSNPTVKASSPSVPRHAGTHAAPTPPFLSQLPFSRPDDGVRTPPTAAALSFVPQGSSAAKTRPFDVYAYSFWRRGNTPTGMLGNGQYGGSQSAIIVNVPVRRFGANNDATRLAVAGRLAVAHGALRERELSAGLKWRPSPTIPVSVTVERRFRVDRVDAFALFASAGQSNLMLPLKFRLDGYGQAGLVSGKSGGAFVDAILQARRPVGKIGPTGLSLGAAAWAGGQDDIFRVDIGPSLAADTPIGGTRLRLEASWRLRAAGNAAPGNGPAITLSTSF